MASEQVTGARPPRVPLYNDPRVRSLVYQIVLAAGVALLVYGAVTNAADHLQKAHIASGFGFWNQTAGFDISQTLIAYNLIVDGPTGEASYEIDLPNGGAARIIGNVIHQSAKTTNPVLVSYGAEGEAWPASSLAMAHNTLVSDAVGAWFLRVWQDRLPPDLQVRVINNLTVGIGVLGSGNPGRFDGNFPALRRMLVDIDGLAYGLVPGALLRGQGLDPRAIDGSDLGPRAEFALPIGTRPIEPPPHWSPGAFQR